MTHYVVATTHAWNVAAFEAARPGLPGEWTLVTEPAQLDPAWLATIEPRYVFFPHWSWRVPDEIVEGYECVCFHMTDVPYGRGGSPLQNLILAGHDETRLTALRMTAELDAGPVYAKLPLLLDGSAQAIYERAAEQVYQLIADLVHTEPQPVPQVGTPTLFKRRRPGESRVPDNLTPARLYDFIRMLDADGYPRAFVTVAGNRLEFSEAQLVDGEVHAAVHIIPQEPDSR